MQVEVQAAHELWVVLHGVEQRRTPGEIPDPADGEAIMLIEWSFFFLCDGPNGSKPWRSPGSVRLVSSIQQIQLNHLPGHGKTLGRNNTSVFKKKTAGMDYG